LTMTGYRGYQPDFWLEIRKEYIIENFEKLLFYTRRYQYLESDKGEGEFLTTCRYLIDLAYELSEQSLSSSFANAPKFKLSNSETEIPEVLAYRIIIAALIASQKINQEEHLLLLRLINLLVISHKMPQTDIIDNLVSVVANCVTKAPILALGVKWDDIENPQAFSPIRLLYSISNTKFDTEKGVDGMFDGKGCVYFTKGGIMAAPLNKSDFIKEASNLAQYLSIGKNIKLLLHKSDHKKTPETPEDVAEDMTFMTRAQSGVKTSVVESKRKYSAGAIIPVVVTSSWGVKIVADTLLPEYENISGKVNINLVESLKYADIFKVLPLIAVGTVLFVEYTPDDREFAFTLRAAFNRFYQEFADQMRGETMPGVYLSQYSAGTQWLTEDGFLVNVMGNVTDENILEAMENNIPLTIRINGSKEQFGNVLVNGSIVNDIDLYGMPEPIEGDILSYQNECFIYIFEEFLKYCKVNAPEHQNVEKLNEVDGESVQTISNILMEHQNLLSDSMSRFSCLQVALMLSITAGNYDVSAYIRHELEYQMAVARFAGGASPMSLSLTHGPNLNGIPEIEKHERIIGMIRNYKDPEIGHANERNVDDENLEDTVDGLIDASNRLLGKIDEREIFRIKYELAKVLDVDDQFKSSDNTTYYGVESDTLEFKSSAVCPPKNRLKGSEEYEPDTQIWSILKTVCGFLNSTMGGDLLLGVKDNGVAVGIHHDYNLLFDDRRILEANADRYRTYLKNIIDNAFRAYKSGAEKTSVTTAYISYNIERNNEDLEILRIHVDSYRGDMVYFHPDCHRPEEIQRSYIRTSGATLPMSDLVRDQTLLKKYNLAGESEGVGMAAIYEARNSKKRVLLKDYASRSGVRDREIEVFQVFPESKCILGYDTALRDVRLFKSRRWKDARILDKYCTQSSNSKKDLRPDIFGFVFDPSKTIYDVEVLLTNYGALIFQEEYPGSENMISQSGKKDFPWLLTLHVNNLMGIARFVRGLPEECKYDQDSDFGAYML
ncbi:MAG: putative DNA binding domain-containing protein, partial [Muribaculaceae bacterium]|nr:putative DNA binding domain-containing protein [Muribaculaceae bacterium]